MAIAPMCDSLRCPTMAVSTMPSSGTVMLVMMFGRASCRIFRFISLFDLAFGHVDNLACRFV